MIHPASSEQHQHDADEQLRSHLVVCSTWKMGVCRNTRANLLLITREACLDKEGLFSQLESQVVSQCKIQNFGVAVQSKKNLVTCLM